MGKDGIRHKDGVPLHFSLLVPGTSTQRQQMAVLLQDMFKRVGARMDHRARGFSDHERSRCRRTTSTCAVRRNDCCDPTPSGIRQEWSTTAATRRRPEQHWLLLESGIRCAWSIPPSATMDSKRGDRAISSRVRDDDRGCARRSGCTRALRVAGMDDQRASCAHARGHVVGAISPTGRIGDGPAPKSASVALAASAH